MTWVPTRAAGWTRLREWVPRAGNYGAERNQVTEANEHVSRLSPWMQKRLLTEAEVLRAVRECHAWSTIEKFAQEVAWRTYWKGWLEHRPTVWARWREGMRRAEDGLGAEERSGWEAAVAGRTGITCFDVWARELVGTGWLHNHVRMWFASIWIFTLRLPWELGAAFFWAYLKDGDAASNTLSWRWVAGLHTPGKIYLARADNIARYTGGRFEPGPRELAKEAVALQEAAVSPQDTPGEPVAAGRIDGRVGRWVLPDDLGPAAGEAAGPAMGVWPKGFGAAWGWAADVEAWTRAALEDRVGPVAEVTHVDEAVMEWATRERLDAVVAWRPFVGPWAETGRRVEAALAVAGVRLIWQRRDWDTSLFPAASRGFFPFWQRSASLVRERTAPIRPAELPLE